MRLSRALTLMSLSASILLALSACGSTAVPASPRLMLTTADRTRVEDPASPALPQPLAPVTTPEARAERSYLWEAVVKPLMLNPSFMITPAPKKPTPVTTP